MSNPFWPAAARGLVCPYCGRPAVVVQVTDKYIYLYCPAQSGLEVGRLAPYYPSRFGVCALQRLTSSSQFRVRTPALACEEWDRCIAVCRTLALRGAPSVLGDPAIAKELHELKHHPDAWYLLQPAWVFVLQELLSTAKA